MASPFFDENNISSVYIGRFAHFLSDKMKKNPALPDSPRPSGAVYGYFPFREVRILPGRTFCSIGSSTFMLYNNTVFPIERKKRRCCAFFTLVLFHCNTPAAARTLPLLIAPSANCHHRYYDSLQSAHYCPPRAYVYATLLF